MTNIDILYAILGGLFFALIVILRVIRKTKPYTNEEWDELLNESWKNRKK